MKKKQEGHTFLTKRITNEDIYIKQNSMETHIIEIDNKITKLVGNQRWHNKAFYTGSTLLAAGFVLLWGKV